jgi:hypothetical protein
MQAQKVTKDEYTDTGIRLFNFTKPHALIYADGHSEAKYLQDGQYYRGDRTPIEGMIQRPNDPPKLRVVETTPEEVAVAKRVDGLEAQVKDLKAGVEQILALLTKPEEKPAKAKA